MKINLFFFTKKFGGLKYVRIFVSTITQKQNKMKNTDLRKVEITKSELQQVIEQITKSKEYILEFYAKGNLRDTELEKTNDILNKMCELNNKSNTFK